MSKTIHVLMKQLQKRFPFALVATILLLIIIVGYCGIANFSKYDVSVSQYPLAFFNSQLEIDNIIDENAKDIQVWIEGTQSMKGFVDYPSTKKCPDSLFKKIIVDISEFQTALGERTFSYYRFDTLIASELSKVPHWNLNAENREVLRNSIYGISMQHKDALTNDFYSDDIAFAENVPKMGTLTAALLLMDRENPAIIFTDMAEMEGELADALLQAAVKELFSDGLSIQIVAMKSSFGGVFGDNIPDGRAYRYGSEEEVKGLKLKQVEKSYSAHLKLRPFYAIVIAKDTECKAISEKIVKTAKLWNEKIWEDYIEENKPKANGDGYGGHAETWETEVISYAFSADVLRNQIATRIQSEPIGEDKQILIISATVIDGQDKPSNLIPTNDPNDILEYKLTKKNTSENQLATFSFNIYCDNLEYKNSFLSERYVYGTPQLMCTVAYSPDEIISMGLDMSALPVYHTRGMFDMRLINKAANEQIKWFSIETGDLIKENDHVACEFSVDVGNLEPGVYTYLLPIVVKREGTPNFEDKNWERLSIARSDFIKAPVGDVTVELKNHLIQISRAKSNAINNTEMAKIIVNLNVVESEEQ